MRTLLIFCLLIFATGCMNVAVANNSGSANASGFNETQEIGSIHNEYEMESAANARLAMFQFLVCVGGSLAVIILALFLSSLGSTGSKYY